jgi:hypothetical protein
MTYRRWISILSIALSGAGWVAAGNVYAATDGYTLDDLKLNSAGALVDVCTIEQGHQDYATGQAFCFGFFEGAIRYAEAIADAKDHRNLVCAPPETTRLQAVEVFVSYTNGNPQYTNDGAIDTIYRALMHRWPCAE